LLANGDACHVAHRRVLDIENSRILLGSVTIETPGQASRAQVPRSVECSREGVDRPGEIIPAKRCRNAVD